MAKPRPGLGRGLDALLPASTATKSRPSEPQYSHQDVFECALERIVPRRDQPRKVFSEQPLEELAQSIKAHGLLEPIVVKRIAGDQFEIIAGERRWRACQRAGLREALVVVKDVKDEQAYEIALVENAQREDLNAIEFAEALRHLTERYGHTQESLATRVGKDRTTITNALRLLKLPSSVREAVLEGRLTEGHARAILGAGSPENMQQLGERAQRGRLSVRQTEAEARRLKAGPTSSAPASKTPSTRDLELRLTRKLGTRCEVKDRNGSGQIVVRYGSLDELDRILDVIL